MGQRGIWHVPRGAFTSLFSLSRSLSLFSPVSLCRSLSFSAHHTNMLTPCFICNTYFLSSTVCVSIYLSPHRTLPLPLSLSPHRPLPLPLSLSLPLSALDSLPL